MRSRLSLILILSLLASTLIVSPALAQTPQPPVVRAVLFFSPLCSSCKQIVEESLPPVIERFGSQLQIFFVDVNTVEGAGLFSAAVETYEAPRVVPFLVFGQDFLFGERIITEFPRLVDSHLAQGGLEWPSIPGLGEYLTVVDITSTPLPYPTTLVTRTSQETQSAPVVQAVLFWMDSCPHCHEVLGKVLPPLQEKYGAQLSILLVEVLELSDIDQLYEIAAAYSVSSERVGVPFLVIGDHVLIGAQQIPAELPDLIESYLAAGGVDQPIIPGLETYSSFTWLATLAPQQPNTEARIQIFLYSTPDCHSCQLITNHVLELVGDKYAGRVMIEMVDIVTSDDVKHLYSIAAGFGIVEAVVDLPMLVLEDKVLIGDEIPTGLPALIDAYLHTSDTESSQTPVSDSNGFLLAIVIMALMVVALIYSVIALAQDKTFKLPAWVDWSIPILIVVGIGVAGYLSYIETLSISAVCGPIGDCNTVQQSPYARLFGFLPIGILGLLGYLGLLAAWIVRKTVRNLAKPAALSFWVMAFFAVVFSLYLTYLEPFVIKAVCLWCLSSSIIVTLLLLLGTSPAGSHFAQSQDVEC
ncbi:MAG: vitamin K epoxide reductase family protein [Anaerolineales bacterium]